ncbi:MAG: ABC transporter permease [Candidatus Brocadiae bacterium]|nr:ABC transporter permease [Candidatus Brocadiia bacterium]
MGLILKYNIRNLFVRRISTLMTLAGIGMVVGVFVVLMALAQGLATVGDVTGDPLQAIILQRGTNAETMSNVSDESADVVETIPSVPRDADGLPLVSRDLLVVLNLPRPDGGPPANVVARGVTDRAFSLHRDVVVDGGRRPRGSDIIVSRSLAKRFASMQVGDRLRFGRRDWNVVAHFDAGGAAWESEIWVDINELGVDFKRENSSSVLYVRLNRPEDLATINADLEANKDVAELKAMSLQAYFDAQTGGAQGLRFVGAFITLLLSVGAGLGAMNTMYAAIANRAREIGTLRALGFSRLLILGSFLFEATLIGLLGGLLGGLLALPVNGLQTGTLNWVTFAETAFRFHVTPGMLGAGLLIGGAVGAIGGFLPALAAARRPILAALRA